MPLVFSSASRAAGFSWPAALESSSAISLQSGASDSSLTSTACWSFASCISVGEDDVSGAEQAIVVPESNGIPGQAAAVALPPGAKTGTGAVGSLNSVSCTASGACVAVGEYVDSSGVTDGLVVPITNGVAGRGVEVTPPGASGESYLRAVSCPPAGACVAVGTYGVSSNAYQEGVVVSVSGGVPGTATEVTLPADGDTGTPLVWVNSVSCWSGGDCVAAGQYQSDDSDAAINPLVVPITNGTPATGAEVKLPANADTATGAQQSVLGSVSCQSTGTCVAVGSYVDTNGGSQPLVVPFSFGAPGSTAEVHLPANAAGGAADDGLNAVSCAPTGECAAVGYYVDSHGSDEALVLPIAGGVGGIGLEAALPANAVAPASGAQSAPLDAVTCPASGSCLAVGDYDDSSGFEQGLTVAVANGAQATGTQAAPPANQYAAVACVVSGSCVAVGDDDDGTAQTQAFQYSLQTRLAVTPSKLPGAHVANAYRKALTATGAWSAYTWSVTKGSLPRGLRLNATTGLISGTPRTVGSHKFTIKAAATGNPAQTKTESLSIAVAPEPGVTLSLTRAGMTLSGRDVSARVSCGKAARCRGSVKIMYAHEVTLKHHKRKRESTVIGQAGYSLAARHARTLKLRLSAAGLKFLKASRSRRLSVAVDAYVTYGKTVSKHTKLYAATTRKKR
ncbi:MAG TPA: Ig domain-containing protein [Solirubrobacteraceae bacterium]|nr:Ig domain-containing protein [Solirubrobacteraceae bacterium]